MVSSNEHEIYAVSYDNNSTQIYKNSLKQKLELKRLQTSHPFGFIDSIYHEGNIYRIPDFFLNFILFGY